MKPRLSLLALAAMLAGCPHASTPPAAEVASPQAGGDSAPTAPADAPQPANTRLTVYSGDYEQLAASGDFDGDAPGFVLVDRTLRYALKAGANRISATGVPRAMDVEATTLKPVGAGLAVRSQRFVAPPKSAGDAIAAALGRKVSVEFTSGGAKQTESGILVSAGDGITLALPDGRIKVIREYDDFSIANAADLLPQQATLQWTVQADKAGDAGFELAYPMGGMAWRAEYLATLAPGDGCKLDFDGAALIANRSGAGFADAKLTLVAGEPKREQRMQRMEYAAAPPMMAGDAAAAAPMPQERSSGEYHAYELPGTFDVANGSTERVPLFARLAGVACTRDYETAPDVGVWQPPQPLVDAGYNDASGAQPVKTTISLKNDDASGLGRALPAGRVRVFDGGDFLGESMLAHTPKGVAIHLETGTAFDLTAERRRDGFRLDRAGRSMSESFTVTLRNAKQRDADIVVVEPLPRWTDWQVTASSVPARKRDAQHAEFTVKVPAGGEAALTYTVQYRWPAGMNP